MTLISRNFNCATLAICPSDAVRTNITLKTIALYNLIVLNLGQIEIMPNLHNFKPHDHSTWVVCL